MERYGLALDQAFNLLREVSSQENTNVSAIARHLVETSGRSQPLRPDAGDDVHA
jgi:AmiR/NasT family two-component response regulator